MNIIKLKCKLGNKLRIEEQKVPSPHQVIKCINSIIVESSTWSPKTLKISDEAMIDVLHKALLGFFIAFTATNITFSL
jgi:predicted nucleic acid binding AN1-type Zn finger protein